ncbi:mCpol domain-containing protein [Acinetobacter kanungonis]|uniref:mCpol domain-containing protein n=1 Tax=Acinetobacter kanungonis TaxID=2699469 RepID=UPI00137B50D7|nr:mCpol domain-containing protein [Acinetobacter kanungonis]NCI78903.1 mCpol domain-containing protein [Acinetobacter kanungonis]
MFFISIDGDDIGQKITASYLNNDMDSLKEINCLVNHKTHQIADFLSNIGFTIMFCAADGVAGFIDNVQIDEFELFDEIKAFIGNEITFSMGVGASMRESYIALLSAKSHGKDRVHSYNDLKG